MKKSVLRNQIIFNAVLLLGLAIAGVNLFHMSVEPQNDTFAYRYLGGLCLIMSGYFFVGSIQLIRQYKGLE